MERNQTSPTQDCHPLAEDENPDATPHQNMPTTAIVNPFINPLLIPHMYYWPYSQPLGFPFAHFPFGPQFQVVCPCHTAAYYFLQQSMMGIPAYPIQFPPMPLTSIPLSIASQNPIALSTSTGPGPAMPLNSVPPSITSQGPIAQSTTTGPGPVISITNNFVAFNEIGNDNSTNGYSLQVGAVRDKIPTKGRR